MAQVNTGIITPLFRKISEGFQKIFIPADHIILSDNKTILQNAFEQLKKTRVMSICLPYVDIAVDGNVDLNLNTLLQDTSNGSLIHNDGGIVIGKGVKTVMVSASLLALYYNNPSGYFWNRIVKYRNTEQYDVATGLTYAAIDNATPWVGMAIPPITIDVKEGDIIKLKKLNVESITIRGLRNTWLTVQVIEFE